MLSGIILAAGESSRMGGKIKQLLSAGDGNFIETVIKKMADAGIGEIIVVLGANAEAIKQATDFKTAKIVINENWREGQLSSLRVGIKNLSADSEGFLLNPCDSPFVKTETYKKIIEKWKSTKDKIHIPVFEGRRGHPAIFPSKFYEALSNGVLTEGAKSVIKDNPESVNLTEVDDPGVIVDIDTFEEYERCFNG